MGCRHGHAPPPPPSCTQAADHVLVLLEPKDDQARDIRGVFETRCREDHWAADVRSCVVGTTSLKDPKHCKAGLAISPRSHLETDLAAAAARVRERSMPEACRGYARIIDKLMSCDQLPRASRDAMKQGYEAVRESWSNFDGPARAAADEGCKAATDAMRQAGSSMGCEL